MRALLGTLYSVIHACCLVWHERFSQRQSRILKNKRLFSAVNTTGLCVFCIWVHLARLLVLPQVFPLLTKSQFPDIDPVKYAFLGPLVGALSRPFGGWLSDKIKSGALITQIVFIDMIIAVLGVISFLPSHGEGETSGASLLVLLPYLL